MLYVDIPTAAEIRSLGAERSGASVSLYVRTTPVTQDVEASRIELRNLMKEAVRQLAVKQVPPADVQRIGDSVDELAADDDFWRIQAESLAVFATPDSTPTGCRTTLRPEFT